MHDSPRAELIKLETDRRLGHEWDEWDGAPLPRGGDFDSPPRLFFIWSAAATAVGLAILFGALWLLRPHLAAISPTLVTILTLAVAATAGLAWVWWALLGASFLLKRPLLPEGLAERGLYLRLMRWTSRVAASFGRRDWVENASVKVYNALALIRKHKVNTGELLLLVPRCLSRDALDGVLAVAKRYAVPVFVATRGQLARRVIKERRPRAVVAVACERDMVSGLHDVAGKVPVLGLVLKLPSGPCKDTTLDLVQLEDWVKAYVPEPQGEEAKEGERLRRFRPGPSPSFRLSPFAAIFPSHVRESHGFGSPSVRSTSSSSNPELGPMQLRHLAGSARGATTRWPSRTRRSTRACTACSARAPSSPSGDPRKTTAGPVTTA
jgi:hypothetical protein